MDITEAASLLANGLPKTARLTAPAIKAGDVIVLECDEVLDKGQLDKLEAIIQHVWPDQPYAIFDSAIKVKVLERSGNMTTTAQGLLASDFGAMARQGPPVKALTVSKASTDVQAPSLDPIAHTFMPQRRVVR